MAQLNHHENYNPGFYNTGNGAPYEQAIYSAVYQPAVPTTIIPQNLPQQKDISNKSKKKGSNSDRPLDFAVLVVTQKSKDTFHLHTFNPSVIKLWSEKTQLSEYVTELYQRASNDHHRVIDRVESLQIFRDAPSIFPRTEKGEAQLMWKDSATNIIFKAHTHVW